MNKTTRLSATALAVYAGMLGIIHAVFVLLQENTQLSGGVFNAIGAPCQPELSWHNCLPAMSLLPTTRISGIIALIFSLLMVMCAFVCLPKRGGAWLLVALSIAMLLTGAGFVPTYAGLIAAVGTAALRAPLKVWRSGWLSQPASLLAHLHPWALILFLIWAVLGWGVGAIANDLLLATGGATFFFFDLLLPLLILTSALAFDSRLASPVSLP